jgi:Protein of unknown function (DUF3108)
MMLKRAVFMICTALLISNAAWADPATATNNNVLTTIKAFTPGEILTYNISWSTLINAGIAVMEVQPGQTINGRQTYDLISTTHSVGILDLVYPVQDRIVSVIDAEELYSLSFDLVERHRKKTRSRSTTFDQDKGTARDVVNQDPPECFTIPPRVQDALSSLYYVRTLRDLSIGKKIIVEVHDSGKNWSVEVHVLKKEKIFTPAGEFDTIEVKTYPKYEGVFMNKGEIYIWFTDDTRRIPVLMKSMISIGSIVATLTEIQGVKEKP